MAEIFTNSEVGSPVGSCSPAAEPQPKPKPVHWIEIQLVGEDNSPISWEEYEVTLPQGEKVRGYVDEKGSARVENIAVPGTCVITFPRLDMEAWTPVK
jgi:hypothetical protein